MAGPRPSRTPDAAVGRMPVQMERRVVVPAARVVRMKASVEGEGGRVGEGPGMRRMSKGGAVVRECCGG